MLQNTNHNLWHDGRGVNESTWFLRQLDHTPAQNDHDGRVGGRLVTKQSHVLDNERVDNAFNGGVGVFSTTSDGIQRTKRGEFCDCFLVHFTICRSSTFGSRPATGQFVQCGVAQTRSQDPLDALATAAGTRGLYSSVRSYAHAALRFCAQLSDSSAVEKRKRLKPFSWYGLARNTAER